MTPEQVLLVRASFAKFAKLGDQAAGQFYERLFALDRAYGRCSRPISRRSGESS